MESQRKVLHQCVGCVDPRVLGRQGSPTGVTSSGSLKTCTLLLRSLLVGHERSIVAYYRDSGLVLKERLVLV